MPKLVSLALLGSPQPSSGFANSIGTFFGGTIDFEFFLPASGNCYPKTFYALRLGRWLFSGWLTWLRSNLIEHVLITVNRQQIPFMSRSLLGET